MMRLQDQGGPGPAYRLVRFGANSAIVVIRSLPSRAEASIGMVAGWPTAEQYEHAAKLCLEKAAAIRARKGTK
jgi:hypothetical protein